MVATVQLWPIFNLIGGRNPIKERNLERVSFMRTLTKLTQYFFNEILSRRHCGVPAFGSSDAAPSNPFPMHMASLACGF